MKSSSEIFFFVCSNCFVEMEVSNRHDDSFVVYLEHERFPVILKELGDLHGVCPFFHHVVFSLWFLRL